MMAELNPALPELHSGLIASIVSGSHPQPHDTLGQHPAGSGFVIRALRPLASTVTAVRTDGSRVLLDHVADGLWQGFASGPGQAYTLETEYDGAADWVAEDPYRFVPSVGEIDLYQWLIFVGQHEGRHRKQIERTLKSIPA